MTIVNPLGKGLGVIAGNLNAQPDVFPEWLPNTLPLDR